jgi:hypothetical protein
MDRIAACVALLFAQLLTGTAAAHISIITTPPDDPSRSVTAEATGHPGLSASTNAGGFWDEFVLATGAPAAGSLSTSAAQVSAIPDTVGIAMSATGSSSASIDMPGGLAYTYRADSTFDVFFEVTHEGVYEFRGDVSWNGTRPEFNSGFTTVVFRDDTNNMPIHFSDADEMTPGDSWDIFPTLSPGIVYQLKVRAHISGESEIAGMYAASTSYSFDLYPRVPEPAAAVLAGFCAMALLGVQRVARRGNTIR